MFRSFFNPENPFFRFTGRVLDIMVLRFLVNTLLIIVVAQVLFWSK